MKRNKRKAGKSKAAAPAPRARWKLNLRYHLDWLVPTIILALFGTTFSVQAFEIPSGSMEDTLLIGERVLVDRTKFAPAGWLAPWMPYRQVRRGDIVVFKFPPDPNVHYVKRIVGLPGDRLRLVHGQLQRNGEFVNEPYVVHKDAGRFDAFRDEFPATPPQYAAPGNLNPAWADALPGYVRDGWLVVPPGGYFVMGDNRDISLDSRYWGFVPQANVLGTPLYIYWSLESTSEDFRAGSQLEWATNFVKRIVLFPFRARWGRMFLPAF